LRLVSITLLFLFTISGVSQENPPHSIGAIYKTGALIAHRQTMKHLVQKRTNAFELEFSKQDTTDSFWSKRFRHPSKGFSFVFQDYGNREVLGTSFSFFRFKKFPIIQSEKFGFLDFKLGNGISYISKKYDKNENIKNVAIGSHINGLVSFQLNWVKHFNRFYLGTGLEFTHISNASIKTPNQGLNTLTALLTAGFNLQPRKVFHSKSFNDTSNFVRKTDSWLFHVFVGIKQNLPGHLESRNFGVLNLQGLYRLRVSSIWDAEFGIDLTYNEANRWLSEIDPLPVPQAFQIGAYSGLSLSLYNTQIYFGLGAYGLNPVNPAGWVYNRAGIRVLTNENWNVAIGIRAHVGIADYLEWGLGYRF